MVSIKERPGLAPEQLQKGLDRRDELLGPSGSQLIWQNLTDKFGIPKSRKESQALQKRRDKIMDRLDAGYEDLVGRVKLTPNGSYSSETPAYDETDQLSHETPIAFSPYGYEYRARPINASGFRHVEIHTKEPARQVKKPEDIMAKLSPTEDARELEKRRKEFQRYIDQRPGRVMTVDDLYRVAGGDGATPVRFKNLAVDTAYKNGYSMTGRFPKMDEFTDTGIAMGIVPDIISPRTIRRVRQKQREVAIENDLDQTNDAIIIGPTETHVPVANKVTIIAEPAALRYYEEDSTAEADTSNPATVEIPITKAETPIVAPTSLGEGASITTSSSSSTTTTEEQLGEDINPHLQKAEDTLLPASQGTLETETTDKNEHFEFDDTKKLYLASTLRGKQSPAIYRERTGRDLGPEDDVIIRKTVIESIEGSNPPQTTEEIAALFRTIGIQLDQINNDPMAFMESCEDNPGLFDLVDIYLRDKDPRGLLFTLAEANGTKINPETEEHQDSIPQENIERDIYAHAHVMKDPKLESTLRNHGIKVERIDRIGTIDRVIPVVHKKLLSEGSLPNRAENIASIVTKLSEFRQDRQGFFAKYTDKDLRWFYTRFFASLGDKELDALIKDLSK